MSKAGIMDSKVGTARQGVGRAKSDEPVEDRKPSASRSERVESQKPGSCSGGSDRWGPTSSKATERKGLETAGGGRQQSSAEAGPAEGRSVHDRGVPSRGLENGEAERRWSQGVAATAQSGATKSFQRGWTKIEKAWAVAVEDEWRRTKEQS